MQDLAKSTSLALLPFSRHVDFYYPSSIECRDRDVIPTPVYTWRCLHFAQPVCALRYAMSDTHHTAEDSERQIEIHTGQPELGLNTVSVTSPDPSDLATDPLPILIHVSLYNILFPRYSTPHWHCNNPPKWRPRRTMSHRPS